MAEALSQEEFARWLTPRQALDGLPSGWGYETKVRWIDGRLESGLILAAASASRLAKQREAERKVVAIPPPFWCGWACLADIDFWNTGDLTFYDRGSTGYGGSLIGHFHGVRFDPTGFEGVAQLKQSADDADNPGDPAERRSLSDALLGEWATLFNKANPGASEARARSALETMFPDRHVTRDRLRRVLPERRQGRPLKSKDK